jgi:hypothetical protein
MKRSALFRDRRRFLLGAGALAVAGVAGPLALNARPPAPLSELPAGRYLVVRAGSGGDERLLLADDGAGRVVRRLDGGSGILYLDAAPSPDGRWLALLKRVPRGSMPTDAIAVYDWRTLRKVSETEAQIDFQDIPPYRVGWSADGERLAVPYNQAGRALIFSVKNGRVALQGMLRRNRFRFHPAQADLALHEPLRPNRGSIAIVRQVPGARDQEIETFAGADAVWSPDGAALAYRTGAASKGTARLHIRDEVSRSVSATLDLDSQTYAWSPDSAHLAVFATMSNDPLRLARFVPRGLVPRWNPGASKQVLLVHSITDGRNLQIGDIPPGFRVAHLQWMNADWLLVAAARASQSFIVDRRGERRRPVPAIDDYSPLVTWLAQ